MANFTYKPFQNAPIIIDLNNHVLIGRYVGSIEMVKDCVMDPNEGPLLDLACYLAYQLVSGEVVAVDCESPDGKTPCPVYSLKGRYFNVRWGDYPADFPKEWEACEPICAAVPDEFVAIEEDELPF